MLAPVLLTPAADPVVTLEEAKLHLRVDVSEDDELIEGLVAAATRHVEKTLGMALGEQEWRQDFASFDCYLRLSPGPVHLDTISVDYRDSANANTALDPWVWRAYRDLHGSYIRLADGQAWPRVSADDDAVRISFTTGLTAEDLPPPLRIAILMLVGAWYENREATAIGVSVAELPEPVGVKALLSTFRPVGF